MIYSFPMAKCNNGLGVPTSSPEHGSGQKSGSRKESTSLRGGLGVPLSHLYPDLSSEEARRKIQEAMRGPGVAEGG